MRNSACNPYIMIILFGSDTYFQSMVAGAEMKNALFEKGKGVQKAASDLGLSDK